MLSGRSVKSALLVLMTTGGLVVAEEVTLKIAPGVLHGTMEMPEGNGPFPLVLIHSGSGPTDRDGNSPALPGKNDSLKMLAKALQAEGIASLRYDKRVAATGLATLGREEDLRFDFLVDDLVAWGEQARKDARFSKLIVLGHSEGALIGILAAQRLTADGYVSVAGTSDLAGTIILKQMRAQPLPADLKDAVEGIVASLNKGETVATTPPALAAIFRLSVQPYLISWFRYDPVAEIAKLKAPVLILQGTTDIQVEPDQARVLARAKPDAKLVMVDGMNHVLKFASGTVQQQLPAYSDPSLQLPPEFTKAVVTFVKSVAEQ